MAGIRIHNVINLKKDIVFIINNFLIFTGLIKIRFTLHRGNMKVLLFPSTDNGEREKRRNREYILLLTYFVSFFHF